MIPLKELLNDHQTGHSELQNNYFVTAKAGGTLYGQYKQSLRELYKRFRGLRELICNKDILLIEIEELSELANNYSFDGRKAKINRRRKLMQLEEAERSIFNTTREFNTFYQQASHFRSRIGDLTPEKRCKLDREMWEFRIKEMIVINLITSGKIDKNTYEIMQALPIDIKNNILSSLKNKGELVVWYEELNKGTYVESIDKTGMLEVEEIWALGE